jgi:hypothetical protein
LHENASCACFRDLIAIHEGLIKFGFCVDSWRQKYDELVIGAAVQGSWYAGCDRVWNSARRYRLASKNDNGKPRKRLAVRAGSDGAAHDS